MEKTLVFGKPRVSSVAIVDYNLLHLGSRVCEASSSALIELGKNFKWLSTRKEINLPVLGIKKIGSDSFLIARILDNGDDESNRPHALRIEAIELDVSESDKSKWIFDPTAWSISDNGFVTVVCPDSQGFISHINIKSNKLSNWKLIPDSDWADYSSSVDSVSKNADKDKGNLWNHEEKSYSNKSVILNMILSACLLSLFIFYCLSIHNMNLIMLKSEKEKLVSVGEIRKRDAKIDELGEINKQKDNEYKSHFGFERPEQVKKKIDTLLSENGKLKHEIKSGLPPDAKREVEEATNRMKNANDQLDGAIRLLRKTADDMEWKKSGKSVK